MGVKFDEDGNYQWTKKIKTDLLSYNYDFKVAKTKDNDFIIMQNYMAGGGYTGKPYDTYIKKEENNFAFIDDQNLYLEYKEKHL